MKTTNQWNAIVAECLNCEWYKNKTRKIAKGRNRIYFSSKNGIDYVASIFETFRK